MRSKELEKIIGRVLLASVPTLALTMGCRTSGEATYVVASQPGADCRQVCQQVSGYGDEGSWRTTEVMECVDATQVPPDRDAGVEPAPVAVCRMRTQYTGGIGRRPEGLVIEEARGASREGAFFARMEHLERASIGAFRRLARELEAHGAPASLVRRAERSVRDEARHARVASRWRARHGGERVPLARAPHGVRPLVEIARENAVEGCVHETWGATIAALQARMAPDPALRADLERIARDEAAHAALAWSVDAWAAARLSGAERGSVRAARADAAERLPAGVDRDLEDLGAAAAALGLPDPASAQRVVALASEAFGWSRA